MDDDGIPPYLLSLVSIVIERNEKLFRERTTQYIFIRLVFLEATSVKVKEVI